jgi:hypothetical protein
MKPDVHRWQGRWRVRWRDFYSQADSREFDTEGEARDFARKLSTPPLTVYDDAYDLAECDQYWRELADK